MFTIGGMRRLLATSIGVTCAAALSLPLAVPAAASPQAPRAERAQGPERTHGAATAADPPLSLDGGPATRPVRVPAALQGATAAVPPRASGGAVPGRTQSIPLAPVGADRATPGATGEQGVTRRSVRPFSLVGVVWDDPGTELRGRVQVRTRATGTSDWSGWQDVETHHHDHGADPGSAERSTGRVRGATAPLWVGDSDGVEVRVTAGSGHGTHGKDDDTGTDRDAGTATDVGSDTDAGAAAGRGAAAGAVTASGSTGDLPAGMRLELVDPGIEPPPGGAPLDPPRLGPMTAQVTAASAANADLAPLGALEIPAEPFSETETAEGLVDPEPAVKAYVGPRPAIVTRRGWGADENLREKAFLYTSTVKAAFVHHTASGNNYTCAQAPSVIRSIYRYHVVSSGWRDIGYNFLVDKCGTIYEGRAGGVAKAVMGAHTLGFNTNSMGVAVIGSFGTTTPPAKAVTGVAKLTAWKLGLFKANPTAKTYLTSGGGNLYAKGTNVRLNVISGHRDGFATACPGTRLYGKLGTIRSTAATLQGR